MFHFFKKEESYEGESRSMFDENSKFGQSFLILKKAVRNVLHIFRKNIEGEQDAHYDLDVDGKPDDAFSRKQRICNVIFLIYGAIAGVLAQEYAGYWCMCVQAFVTGTPITSYEQPPIHIVALLLGIIIVFSVYVSVGAVAGCLYVLLKATLLRDGGEDEVEMLQIAFMYAMMEIVVFGLICLILPWNLLVLFKY